MRIYCRRNLPALRISRRAKPRLDDHDLAVKRSSRNAGSVQGNCDAGDPPEPRNFRDLHPVFGAARALSAPLPNAGSACWVPRGYATLAIGTGLVDALGSDLKVDVLKDWQPDDTLFSLIRDKDTLTAMLGEVAGNQAADTYLTATGTRKKEIMRNALAGTSRRKTENWKPRWMAFPQGQYTKRPLTVRGRAGA